MKKVSVTLAMMAGLASHAGFVQAQVDFATALRVSGPRSAPAGVPGWVPVGGQKAPVAPMVAQATLPPTPATLAPLPTAVPASALTAAERASHRADVIYAAGLLEIKASNSSLNQILRQIAHETGIKITGGVTDERVYGKFGPAPPAEILASLLDGTTSNMFFDAGGEDHGPTLTLTARLGGPTPPGPGAYTPDDAPQPPAAATQAQLPAATSVRTPAVPNMQPNSPDTPSPPTRDASGFVSAPTSHFETEPGTTPGPTTQATGMSDPQPTDPQSPNGVKTPEQIAQEILARRQTQQPTPP